MRGWRCGCPAKKCELSGRHSRLCFPPPPDPPHWCCNNCTSPYSRGRRCNKHPRAGPTVNASTLWGDTVSGNSATLVSRSFSPYVVHCNHMCLVAPTTDCLTLHTLRIRASGRIFTRWALTLPCSVRGSLCPLLPLTPRGELLAAKSNPVATKENEALPGVSKQLLSAIRASPCASERWWFVSCASKPHRSLLVAPGIRRSETSSFATVVPPITVCKLPITPIPPGGSVSTITGTVHCGRCGESYATTAEYVAACAPDAAVPLVAEL